MSMTIGMSDQINCGKVQVLCLMRLGPSAWGKKGCVCIVHCVFCLIQTYNVNSYNILGLH